MKFEVNYLGCGSATSTYRHQPSCQVVNFREKLYMIDCGEGAQLQMRRLKLKFSRLRHIFISHLHGDHFLGLPGLLSTMALHDIGGTVTIHCFKDGIDVLRHFMRVFCRETSFEIVYHEIDPSGGVVLEDKDLTVTAFPLNHRVDCVGFRFDEHPSQPHIDGEMVKFLGLSISDIKRIKEGGDYTTADGRYFENSRLTIPCEEPRSYAYCSDTKFDPRIVGAIENVSTLYHEATYCEDNVRLAGPRGHSTARQAGEIATMAHAAKLVLGHYSKRYENDECFAQEATQTFAGPVIAAHEGLVIEV